MKQLYIFFAVAEIAMLLSDTSYDVELVFKLNELFNSDLILLVRDGQNGQ